MDISNNIQVIPVKTSDQLKTFIDFPYKLYKNDLNWVPPLRITQRQLFNQKNIFWKKNPHCFFIVMKNKHCVGRIAAFVNKTHNKFQNKADGFFGFIEAEDDAILFGQLFAAAENFLRQYGCTQIIGPMNFDIHNELGVLTDGFDLPPYLMLTHNYKYYDARIKANDYNKLKDFYSYKLDASNYVATEKMERVSNAIKKRNNITLRNPDIKHFTQELELFHSIYNDAFTEHWGFSPIDKEEFIAMAKDMKSIIDTRIILIAEVDKTPAAFLLCLPNLNEIFIKIRNGKLFPSGVFKLLAGKKNIKSARVITVAVKKAYQHLGLGALLYPEIMKQGLKYNYKDCELSWVVEDNYVMNQIAKDVGGIPYKTYRLYSKPL